MHGIDRHQRIRYSLTGEANLHPGFIISECERSHMSGKINILALFTATLLMLLTACSGHDGITPAGHDPGDTPARILDAFAYACINSDIESACGLLQTPDRWRNTLEMASDILPFFGNAVKNAVEIKHDNYAYQYSIELAHPDDPFGRVLETSIYVTRLTDLNGNPGPWRVNFTNPGTGNSEIQRIRHLREREELFEYERTGQWGTLDTHATLLTKSILAYYLTFYPEDTHFTGPRGFLRLPNFHWETLVEHPGAIETILFFDYDNYDSMPPEVALAPNVAWALIQAGSADEDVFVGELNTDGSVNYTREVVIEDNGGVLFHTTNTFGDDDDTFLKGFAHFYTPINQNTWQTEFWEFDDLGLLGGTGGAGVKAFDWALGQGVLGSYDILGILEMRSSRNRKTLPMAIHLINEATACEDGKDSIELLANAFYTFGFTLHLLEDASCPAHVRNDMHGVPIISSIPGLGGLQPDPIEDWGETLTSSFVAETTSLFNSLVAQNNPILRDETGFPTNAVLQNLYTHAEYADFAGPEALYKYMALYANRMCFSEDTIYTSTNYDAANTDHYPYLTDLDLDFFGKSVVYGEGGAPFSGGEYILAVGNTMFDVWRSWFWTTHWFSDPEVEDVEDALHDGWDILTVADDDDEDYFSNGVTGVREQQWRILFPHTVRTGAAYLHEFYMLTHPD